MHLQITPVSTAPLHGLRMAIEKLVHEFVYRRSHFHGLTSFSLQDHDDLLREFDGPGIESMIADGVDPIDKLLQVVVGDVIPTDRCADADAFVAVWQRAESTLNARFKAFFGLLEPETVACVLDRWLPDFQPWGPMQLAEVDGADNKRIDFVAGQPDLVLVGKDSVLLVEMKVRGLGKVGVCYGADQHLKYMNLVGMVREDLGSNYHVVLVAVGPRGGNSIFRQGDRWLSVVDDSTGKLAVDTAAARALLEKARWQRYLDDPENFTRFHEESARTPTYHLQYHSVAEAADCISADDSATRAALVQLGKLIEYCEPTPS